MTLHILPTPLTKEKHDELAAISLRYWNSIKVNYPNLQPDSSDFWEVAPSHLLTVLRDVYIQGLSNGLKAKRSVSE